MPRVLRLLVPPLAGALLAGAPLAARAAAPATGPLADDPTLIALAVSLAVADAPQQGGPPPAAQPAISPDGPELELVATVRAKALTFREVPHVDVVFKGNAPHRTTWKTERVNLPMHPQPGVTYHDVAVRLTISSTVDQLGDLLAQAKRAAKGIQIEPDDAPAAKPQGGAAAPAAPKAR